MLNVGDIAPDFTQADQTGNLISLDKLLAEGELILYFYPADFTPVCTAEACVFRDNFADLENVGMQIVGVSPQSSQSHQRFAGQFDLPFPLLADEGKALIRAYGVDGPMGFGVRRATFLIGIDKTIQARVVSDFFVGSHKDLVLATIAEKTQS